VAQTLRDGIDGMVETADEAERQLIRRIGAGEREALTALFLRFRTPLFGYLLRVTECRELAEDVLQETFIAVWRGASTYSGRSTARTWLFGIAHHQAHNVLRRAALPVAEPVELERAESPWPTPEEASLAAAERTELYAAVRRLSLIHREVLALAFGQELAIAEIAVVLDIPVGTVKSRLRDAKRALRADLGAGKDHAP
jgi:RNA polymerase sigma-70 factor (ECF subfamily)